MRAFAFLIALALSAPRLLAAQGVLVAPHVVFMDHRTRSAAITLYNPGTEPAEVSIATFFGYPVTDSAGDFELATPVPDSSQPSAAGWIEAFPRRIVVQPLQRQTVRLLGRPPAGLADGEYWSRLIITAKGGSLPVAGADTTQAIQIGLSLEVRTIIPLQYRKGDPKTGVRLANLRASRVGDSVVVRAELTREGNAAFVGTARGTLTNAAGATVGTFAVPLAVYYAVDPRFSILGRDLPAGQYRLTPPADFAGPRTYDALSKAGVPLFAYGNFLTVAINFIILAFIIFIMVRQVNRMKKAAPPPAPAPTPEDVLLLREIRDALKK